ncbi:hypothetical protein [Glycomyces buryatensis]|uniref:Uncharacterized protein n=1 Tax=Glycomyces buryatensis TaxID=2570927 RepID=A0A4S8QN45_9ACTN|nr:hypothetical protein [Glycomyces buryatensis]THV42154.1 hypothetical protein FAB82_07910 [Glycomyces buryatensis]
MDRQAWEQQHDPEGRIRYIAEFLPAVWGGVNTMFTPSHAYQFESFGVDGGDIVHATAVVNYRGRRCSYRRQIWPPQHPALLAAQLYTTFLEERLNSDIGLNSGGTGAVEL